MVRAFGTFTIVVTSLQNLLVMVLGSQTKRVSKLRQWIEFTSYNLTKCLSCFSGFIEQLQLDVPGDAHSEEDALSHLA